MQHRTVGILISIVIAGALASAARAASFQSAFKRTPNRVWAGEHYWANPMEDWRVRDGRLECISTGADRNIHVLTAALGETNAAFSVSVRVALLEKGAKMGTAGFRLGARAPIDDYRAAALRGKGLACGITGKGELFIGKTTTPADADLKEFVLRIDAKPADGDVCELALSVFDAGAGKKLCGMTGTVGAGQLAGGIALVNNDPLHVAKGGGARFAFSEWKIDGDKIESHPERAFGPILWAMHSLSNSRRIRDRYVLKMTAQMPPLGKQFARTVDFQTKTDGEWQTIGKARVHADACTATFRIPNWPADRDVPYRLKYRTHTYEGTVRRNPVDRPVVIAGFTGNQDYVFPNNELVRNVGIHNPDVLFFSGDQIYENVGGYGIVRTPADRSILNYLRKWYLVGWAFGDLMRDRGTICLPDDHDVYQGNIWGQSGRDCGGMRGHDAGGYAQPVKMVNAVHRTQTAHHPDVFNPTPIDRGIGVFYGDMVYGRVRFGIIADRRFKSGPKGKVNDWKGRSDHCKDVKYDTGKLDKAGLKLLGDRQLEFLETWAKDWRGTDMKIVLSQTIFCNLANYHGGNRAFIFADLDSNGWPQTGRNKAVDVMRRAFAFHYAGDQHLPSIVHHGIDAHRDANWSFCVPSIAAGYPRSWLPDKEGRPVLNRPAPGLPNTGDYRDAFGNYITVHGIGNPALKNRPGPVYTAHDKSSGYGIVRMNKANRTITMECWRLLFDAADPKPEDQFPGWPKTVSMFDNYGREAVAYLPTVKARGLASPVIQIINQEEDRVEYTVRIKGDSFKPKVFRKDAKYIVRVGDPDTGKWKTLSGVAPDEAEECTLEARF